jgi:hypothetical protein
MTQNITQNCQVIQKTQKNRKTETGKASGEKRPGV